MRMKKRNLGFTFIEMMLASAMLAVISIALFGMIGSGLKVWQIVNQESPQMDAALLFEKMSTDLENGIAFKDIDFSGNENSFSFSCVSSTTVAENGFNQGVGQVKYSYDYSAKAFNRQYIDYEQLSLLKQSEPRVIIKDVSNMLLSYYFFDAQKRAFLWSNIWPPESYTTEKDKQEWPLAVRVSMVFDTHGVISQKMKTLNIPIGGIEF